MADVDEVERIEMVMNRKLEDLGETHDEEAAKVFRSDALELMEQNYMNLSLIELQDELDGPPVAKTVDFMVTVRTGDENVSSNGQSVRSQKGCKVNVDLARIMQQAADEKGLNVKQRNSCMVSSISVQDAVNDMDIPVSLTCEINDRNVGLHHHAISSDNMDKFTAPAACLYTAMPHQKMHLGGEGRLVYGNRDGDHPLNETKVKRYGSLLNEHKIDKLYMTAPGSTVVEYSSPIAKLEDGTLVSCDNFVNLMYKHPKFFDPARKVTTIETNASDNNDNIINLRIPSDAFHKVCSSMEDEILTPLKRHMIDLRAPNRLTFKIIPAAQNGTASDQDTDDHIDQAERGMNSESGALHWNTMDLQNEKRAAMFNLKVTMQYL